MKTQCSGFIVVIDEEQAHFEIIKRELCFSHVSVPKRAGIEWLHLHRWHWLPSRPV